LEAARADVRERARRDKGGIEDAARRERYAFLASVLRDENAEVVAVAHTRDDQAETLLLRLLRGSGSQGLSSMRARSGDIVRPLLEVSRAEVLEHNRSRGLIWREDPSNSDPVHLRNRVRHELLPYLESRFNPGIRETLARSARLLGEEADLVGALADRLLDEALVDETIGTCVVLKHDPLRRAPRAVARGALRRAATKAGLDGLLAVHVERILALAHAKAPSGRRVVLPGGAVAEYSFDELRIGLGSPAATPFSAPLPVPGAVDLPGGGRIEARADSGPAADRGDAVVVPVPEAPLAVRTRLPGDRVVTRSRTVSLKRFLMDRHVPAPLRGDLPLVASGREVVWVPGQPFHPPAEPRPDRGFVRLQRLTTEPAP
jgi:tRNA(Ile)-lysidine synthase